MYIDESFFVATFIVIYLTLVAVEFLAFLLLWRLSWRHWWQFFLTGFAFGFSSLFVYHGVDVVVFGATGSFTSLYSPLSETLVGLLLFALWAGLEMLIIRWICGITPLDKTSPQ